VIEWIIAVVYMLLIAAGWLVISALPLTAQRRAALTHTPATPTSPITPDDEAGVRYPPASPFSPRAPIRARRAADRNVRPTGLGRGIGSRRGGRRA